MTTLAEALAAIRAKAEKDGSLMSDDFGHDTHALLAAESALLQEYTDIVPMLIRALEVAIEQRDKYHSVTLLFNKEDQLERQKDKCDAAILEILLGEKG